jgi:type I restriction enzyme, R subunit
MNARLLSVSANVTPDERAKILHKGFVRKPPKRIDYLLRYTRDFPLAVIEAKPSYKSASDAVQQSKQYAEMIR